MNFFMIAAILLVGYMLQFFFGAMQIKDFTRAYSPLKRKGRVAIGRVNGALRAGAIILLCIDEDAIITDGAYMMGVTVLAKFKQFDKLNGRHVGEIEEAEVMDLAKPLRRAILDASFNYNTIMNGGEIPRRLSPLEKFNNLFTRKKKFTME